MGELRLTHRNEVIDFRQSIRRTGNALREALGRNGQLIGLSDQYRYRRQDNDVTSRRRLERGETVTY